MKAMLLLMALLIQAGDRAIADPVRVLDISTCSGSLTLQQSSDIKEPKLVNLSDSADVLARVEAAGTGWALRCQEVRKSKPASGRASVSGQSAVIGAGVFINRAVGPGANAVQNIGGNPSSNSGSERSRVQLMVPTGVRIVARSWAGYLDAARGVWTVNAELAGGQMQFFGVHDSSFVVDAGSLSVQEATGRLSAHLRGAASIEVTNMRDTILDLQLTGAGSMQLKGRAASARVLATGAGHIEIERVTSEPLIQLRGAATVDIGR